MTNRERRGRCCLGPVWTSRLLAGLLIFVAGVSDAELPPLRSASEIAYPPFCVVDAQGRADGFAVELLREALRAMDRDVTFRVAEWAAVRGWLEAGEVDALPLVGRTPEREALYDFTFPYMTLFGAIVVRADATGIASLDDLGGRRVAVMRGDNAEEFLRRQDRGFEIQTVLTFEQALRELSAGHHDAVVVQRLVAMRLLHETGLDNLRILPRPLETFRQDFCFAVRKGDAATLALLNEGLALVIADGTYRRLHAKWFAALELPSDRRLIIGGDHAFPPYEYLNAEGLPEGFAVDLVRAIAREMGLDIDIRLGPWNQAVRALETGEIDVLQGVFYSEERSQRLDFTVPHAYQHYVSVVRAGGAEPPESFAALQGLTVAVQDGDLIHEQLMASGFSGPLVTAESQEAVLEAVADGRADCGLVMRLSVARLLDGRRMPLVLGHTPVYAAEYCMAVRKGATALLTQLNEGLRLLQESGEYRQIQQKWLGVLYETPPLRRVVARALAWFVGPVLVVFAFILLWIRMLRRVVAARTARLKESESNYRHLIENMHEIIYTLDTRGVFTYASPAWTPLLGHAVDAIIGRPFQPLVHPDDVSSCEAALQEILKTGNRMDRVEYRVRHADGRWCWHVSSVVPLRDEAGVITGVEGIASDITAHKQSEAARLESERQRERLQAQLNEAQKMESVGRLAGGVAHDFNNLLMAILGYVELARDRLPPEHPAREDLDEVTRNAQRSADLTRQLLAFARRQTVAPERLDLNDTIASMLKLLQRLLGEGIDLVWMPGRIMAPVMMDPSQVDQILANLCVNARDAIAGVGKLTIETEAVTIDTAYCEQHAEAVPGEFVMLGVSDSGEGISPETMRHIFEPFFTTKGVGQGTGLGLATVYGIVKQNGGFINVYSEVGQGTTFKIYLPMAKGEVVGPPDGELPPPVPVGGTETLLLVEDEGSIRKSLDRFLQSMGYTVLAAAAPEEALQRAAAHAGSIPLLITDVVMPGMSGLELSTRLRALRPDIRTLYMSGYTANAIAHHGVLDEGIEFLQKPVTMAALSVKVRTLLDAPA